MHISHGGLQHGKVRPFAGQKQRTGFPDDVVMIVEKISAKWFEIELGPNSGATLE